MLRLLDVVIQAVTSERPSPFAVSPCSCLGLQCIDDCSRAKRDLGGKMQDRVDVNPRS